MAGRLLFFLFAFALGISAASSTCTPPREGIWLVTGYEWFIEFRKPANGFMNFTRDPTFPSIYTGRGIFYMNRSGLRLPFLFFLHTVFDEKDCRMYGTNLSPQVEVREVIDWAIDSDEAMHGTFSSKFADSYVFPYTCMHTLYYDGENTDANMESLLANAGDHSF